MTLPPTISSRSNARVKALRAAFMGKATQAGELIGIEGETLLKEVLRSSLHIDSIFVQEGRETELELPEIRGGQAQVFVLRRDVFASAVPTGSPQGIAALLPIPQIEPVVREGNSGLTLLLECVQDPGNLGTLLRAAEAFGVSQVMVTPESVNPWNPKAIRASAGSVFRVPVRQTALQEAKLWMAAQGVRLFAAVAQAAGATACMDAELSGSCALMIGNEGAGLSHAALELADERIHIPCQTESLNAAAAGATLLYEAMRQRSCTYDSRAAPRSTHMSLFDTGLPPRSSGLATAPLADRMRPRTLNEFVGQQHLLGPGKPLRVLIAEENGNAPGSLVSASLIFWGPPGVGKTTLAKIIAQATSASFIEFSAVLAGIKEIKQVMAEAEKAARFGSRTILFIDEIHRFNKAQQDAFLPYVERGAIRLIGATTENPSFEINAALLSRCRVYTLQALSQEDILALLRRALADSERGLGPMNLTAEDAALAAIASYSSGDARNALNALEVAAKLAQNRGESILTAGLAAEALQQRVLLYDKRGEQHYDLISALHKSVRNSDADASLYWLGRMLQAGEDPMYVARRVVRMAVEDIGLAAPEALNLCLSARDAMHFLGSPEGDLALAEAVVYLALAPKSNAVYAAYGEVLADIEAKPAEPVPLHLRNAPTKLMKELDYGKDYQYAHDVEGRVADMECLPPSLAGRHYYQPSGEGREKLLAQRMEEIERIKGSKK